MLEKGNINFGTVISLKRKILKKVKI